MRLFLPRFLVGLSILSWAAMAQTPVRTCEAVEHLHAQMLLDPTLAATRAAIEAHTQAVEQSGASEEMIIQIPVVVHVVYNVNNAAAENLSDAQIQSQITVLNEDFQRLNADASATLPAWQGVAANSEFSFCLATRDPSGNPTTGITRTSTAVTSFSLSNAVKSDGTGGKSPWPSSSYLNMWVCDLGGGLLGYATFPGGNPAIDGVVCDFAYFGRLGTAVSPFNLGRTATHEVGHWLNLAHIWGDSSTCGVDGAVAGTPPSDAPTSRCTPPPPTPCGIAPMYMNYMDYSNDNCMNLFTQGQKTRMRALFSPGGARESILSSQGCAPLTPQFQMNQPVSSLTIDGVAGTAFAAATTSKCINTAGTFSFGGSNANLGLGYDLGISPSAPVGVSSGGIALPNGQFLNLALPGLIFLSTGGATAALMPWPGSYSVPFSSPAPINFSFQMINISPSSPGGFALSQAARLNVTTTSGTFPAGPTGDDSSVTVSLAGVCPAGVAFYGTRYTTMGVASNGRVILGNFDTDFSPTVAESMSDQPSTGFWTDLDPTTGGTISISLVGGTTVRVFYNGIRHYGEANPNVFAIEFNVNTNTVALDGLAGILANTGAAPGDFQWLGISRGAGLATNPGTTNFTIGGSGSQTGNAMLYDFYNASTSVGGIVPSLAGALNRIVFTPAGSNYSWQGS